MAFAPGNRLFFTEKNVGEVKIMQDDIVLPQPFVKLRNVYVAQHQGLLGITLDPRFDTNHYVYVYYTYRENQTASVFNKVVRFTELNNKATEEKVLLDKIPASPDGEFAGEPWHLGLTINYTFQLGMLILLTFRKTSPVL